MAERGRRRSFARTGAILAAALITHGGPASAQEAPVLTLDGAVERALERNHDLESARLALEGARAQAREAWSAVHPSVSATAGYTRNLEVPGQFLPARFFDPNAPEGEQVLVRFGADNAWLGQLRLEQPLFQATALIGVGAAARFAALQEETLRGRTQEIVTRTRQRYFEVLLAREAERLSGESVRRVRQTLEEARAMQRAGLTGEYDVLRLEVELANLEPALRRARNGLEAARRALAMELGMEARAAVEVAGSLAGLRVSAEAVADTSGAGLLGGFALEDTESHPVEELVELALANRSELRQLRLTETLRTAELRAEQAEYLPKVSLFATYAYSGQADGGIEPFGFGGARSVTTPQVGLQVTVPLYGGLARPARVQQKRVVVQQVEAQTRRARLEVEHQVKTLLDQVQEARARADAQARARAQAQRGYEIAHAQYRGGVGSRLELTDAEVALRQSEFNYAQAVYDYLSARIQLEQALGVVEHAR